MSISVSADASESNVKIKISFKISFHSSHGGEISNIDSCAANPQGL